MREGGREGGVEAVPAAPIAVALLTIAAPAPAAVVVVVAAAAAAAVKFSSTKFHFPLK